MNINWWESALDIERIAEEFSVGAMLPVTPLTGEKKEEDVPENELELEEDELDIEESVESYLASVKKEFSRVVKNDSSLSKNIKIHFMNHKAKTYNEDWLLCGTVSGVTNYQPICKKLTDKIKVNGKHVPFHSCYLPGDVFVYIKIPKNINEACKNETEARKFVSEVGELAKKYNANYFIVTDGVSGIHNDGNEAVANARNSHKEWEKTHGFDPEHDWKKESADTIEYHTLKLSHVPSSLSFKSDVLSETSYFSESWLVMKSNLELNLSYWKPGNPLFITGASGDGKSTLATKLAKENNAIICHTDVPLCRLHHPKEKVDKWRTIEWHNMFYDIIDKEWLDDNQNLPYDWKSMYGGYCSFEIFEPYLIDYINYVLNKATKDLRFSNRMIIIEGCDLCKLDPEFYLNNHRPLIIIGSSRVKNLYWRAKRDCEKNGDDTNIFREVMKQIKRYATSTNKELDDNKWEFRKKITNYLKDMG